MFCLFTENWLNVQLCTFSSRRIVRTTPPWITCWTASVDWGRTALSTPVALWGTKRTVGIRTVENRKWRKVEEHVRWEITPANRKAVVSGKHYEREKANRESCWRQITECGGEKWEMEKEKTTFSKCEISWGYKVCLFAPLQHRESIKNDELPENVFEWT